MRALALAIGAMLVVVGCDPTWAIVVENATDAAVTVRVDTRPFDGDDAVSTVYLVDPATRIMVGGHGVGSNGQVVRVWLLSEDCEPIDSRPVAGFDDGGVVRIDPERHLVMIPGGNPTAGDQPVVTHDCP